ncbi:MAG: hypothetical protein FWG62_04035 [Proteobacteria bacterium]|nr:hypothetical protein [Pseudomonadota bacterium]
MINDRINTYKFYQGDGHDAIVDDGDNIIVYQNQVVAQSCCRPRSS